jgi:hypothetical protein
MVLLGGVVTLGPNLTLPALAAPFDSPLGSSPAAPAALRPRADLPLFVRPNVSCASTGEAYGTLEPLDPAAGNVAQHPDMNLAVRGYVPTAAALSPVDYAGDVDPNAPQLVTLFGDRRTPLFTAAYRVYQWDWNCNCRGRPIAKWDVTLLGMRTTPGEIIHLPVAGYDVGGGYGALVLYAEPTRLTLK